MLEPAKAILQYVWDNIIVTYTQPGDLILDYTSGSGSMLEAAARTGRRAIGIEKEQRFIEMAD